MDRLRILVACEESQAVTCKLRERGHLAFSCDIIDQSGGYPQYHIMDNVIPLRNGKCQFKTTDGKTHNVVGKWDMIIAFPPCTDLCVSGARHFDRKIKDGTQQRSIDFFMNFVNADCDKIAIENPIGIMSRLYRKPDQIIQPYWFGDKAQKSTCLWLKGLPLLTATDMVEKGEFIEWVDKKTGKTKKQAKWFYDALKAGKDRGKIRSKTFNGIANAISSQWTEDVSL